MTQKAVFLPLHTNNHINIEFENVSYTVPNGRKGKKSIIKGVSGKFKSGELTAIMGPSGAGKTSLLNILTGFKIEGMKGTIKSCRNKNTKTGTKEYKKESCYIMQDDQLVPYFTVQEIMSIATDLKLGKSLSEKAKKFRIDDALDALGLIECKTTRCQRLSGGQKKRLSIALELIDNPPIMFLDEPTTGLDSLSSTQCITMLKALACGGRTIICTIHQPSATIYEMFDHIYAMADGECVYQGGSQQTVPFLASVGFHCPKYHNPADYLIEVISGEFGSHTSSLVNAVSGTHWRSTANDSITSQKLETQDESSTNISMVLNDPPSELFRFYVLLCRILLQINRDWTVSHLKVVLHLLVGIFLGCFYYKAGDDGSKAISNIGFFIVSAVYLCYTSMMPAVLKFPSELAVLKKERFNNWYQLKTYYLAFLISDIPLQAIFTMAYISSSYFLSDQPPELARFARVSLVMVLVTLVASSFGILIGTTVNPINGTFIGAISICLMLSVAGFLILLKHIPTALYWLSYVSYLSYAFEASVEAVYGFDRLNLPCPNDIMYCHYKRPQILLEQIGMDKHNYWYDISFLVGNVFVLRFVAFFALRRTLRTG